MLDIKTRTVQTINDLQMLLIGTESKLKEVKKGGKLKDLVEFYRNIYDTNESIKSVTKELNKIQDSLRYNVVPEKMEEQDLKTVTFKDLNCRITVSQVVKASIFAEQKEGAYLWLRREGYSAVVKETVNASTLSAIAKEKIESGNELPKTVFNVHTSERISLTKLNKEGDKTHGNKEEI